MHRYLIKHPQIANTRKETNYFCIDDPTRQGFYNAMNCKNNLIPCDVSPKYFRTTGVAKKIHRLFPNARLVLMLRDPVDRIYSNYWMNRRQGLIKTDFEDTIRDGYLNSPTTRYKDNLDEWLEYFPIDQITLVSCKDFFSDSVATVNRLFEKLGLSPINLKRISPVIPSSDATRD